MSAQNQAYARARIQNFAGQFPNYGSVADVLINAIESGSDRTLDAVGQAMMVLNRIAEGFSLLHRKRITLDVTIQLRKREAEVIGLLVAEGGIAEADVSRILENARDFVEQLEAAERDRAAAQEKLELHQAEQKFRLEAERMGVGEALAACETAGKASLDGDRIIVRGGANQRQRIIIQTRRRDLILALQGREHEERV
jgi:hypothetical protein